jgi:hypothetical protein
VSWIKKSIVFALIGLVFSGSVGLAVFAHLCSVDGVEISYFTPAPDACSPEELDPCCAAEQETDSKVKLESEKCCTEIASYYKISTENADKILQLKFLPKYTNAFVLFPEIFPGIYEKEQFIAFTNTDPPNVLSGRDILISHQVFRI